MIYKNSTNVETCHSNYSRECLPTSFSVKQLAFEHYRQIQDNLLYKVEK